MKLQSLIAHQTNRFTIGYTKPQFNHFKLAFLLPCLLRLVGLLFVRNYVQIEAFAMKRIRFDQDIKPLSEFRSGVASFIKQINETRRPLVITQRGKGVAVVLDVEEYEAMQEKIELLEEMRAAEAQLASGMGISNEDARANVLERIKK